MNYTVVIKVTQSNVNKVERNVS